MRQKHPVEAKFHFESRKQKELKMSYLAEITVLSQTGTMSSKETKISVSLLDLKDHNDDISLVKSDLSGITIPPIFSGCLRERTRTWNTWTMLQTYTIYCGM